TLLAILRQMSFLGVSWDFNAYRRAAEAMHAGVTPYPDPSYYTYPPALATWFGRAVAAMNGLAGHAPMDAGGCALAFLPSQILQLIAVAVIYLGLYRGARACGMTAHAAALLVALLIGFNEPLILTIGDSQMNLIMLAMVVGAAMLAERAAWAAGFGL